MGLKTSALLLLLTSFAAPAAWAQADPDVARQRAAMDKIRWLAGAWEGEAVAQGRDGESRTISVERVRLAAGGLALLVEGRHYRALEGGARGEVVHDTAGMITFDPVKGGYRFSTQLQNGRAGVHEAEVDGEVFRWKLPLPGGHVRYDITRGASGQWMELGHFCRDGAACMPVFRMTLNRLGDAP